MSKVNIDIITGYTKDGKPKTKKCFVKGDLSFFEAYQAAKLGKKMFDAGSKEYSDEMDQMSSIMEVLDETLDFITRAFDNQFTVEELQKSLPADFQKGMEIIAEIIGALTGGGDVEESKKFTEENQN